MEHMKKLISMLLCFAMLLSFVVPVGATETADVPEVPAEELSTEPSNVEEAEETEDEAQLFASNDAIYVLAGSDFQADSHAIGANNVKNILTQIQQDYPTMDGFLFAGDYDQNDSFWNGSKNGQPALQEAVQSIYGTEMHEIYVQGNHEKDSLVGSICTASGANDAEGYGVYVINEKDYMWYNDSESTIKDTANALDAYLDAKVEAEYDAPIFVISHLPLHYSMRTYQTKNNGAGGDGKHANYIFDVLNEAGEAGLNIIFLFGHNHSHGWDDYLGGAAIYLAKGDQINIAQNSTTVYSVETLNFTYMNAGYVGYYGDTGNNADQTLTMSVFKITDDKVVVSRYDADGVHNLKSEGFYGGEYPDNESANPVYAENKTVYGTTQTIELSSFGQELPEEPSDPVVPEEPETPKTLTDATGVSVTALGITALNVDVVESAEVSEAVAGLLAGNLVAYDITVEGFENYSGNATVRFPIPEGMNAELFAVYHVGGEAEKMEGQVEDGFYVFETDHFSTYVGGEIATVADEEGVSAEGMLTLVQIMSTSELETGVGYLIVPDGETTTLTDTPALSGSLDASNTNLWYRDSNGRLRFGSANATNKYLRLTSSWSLFGGTTYSASVGSSSDAANEITGSNGVFEIERSNIYLNHSGNSVGATGTSSNSTKWNFYKVLPGTGSAVKLTVNPESVTVQPDMTAQLTVAVLVDNVAASNYKLTYSSSDTEYVTVSDTGVITGVKDGSATITVTLTEANGKKANGIIQVQIPVAVVSREFDVIGLSPMRGDVFLGSVDSTPTGSVLTIRYKDNGETATVPVTLGMLGGNFNVNKAGEYEGLTVTYGGKSIDDYTLTVLNPAVNHYPEYPKQGAIKVNKTSTGIDFQSSGVTRVELSATGLPAGKGADVVIVIDTSSSMEKDIDGQTPSWNEKSRIQILSETLKDVLEDLQKADPVTGIIPDVEIAIIDFNGYANRINGASLNNSYRSNADNAKVYTGTTAGGAATSANLSAASFVKSTTINATTMAGYFTASNCHSGTNYDGALHDTYELLKEKKAANEAAGVERDQYVIFLSDGAPYRYNGFNHGETRYDLWNKWLSGDWGTIAEVNAESSNNTYTYFYNGNGTNHPHRVAEAIKGETGKNYTVVGDSTTGGKYTMEYEGLGATIYAIGFGLASDGNNSRGYVTKETQMELIRTISSGEGYYNDDVTNADELNAAFKRITDEISFAATNARFVDQMGENYKLLIGDHDYAPTGSNDKKETITPTIEVLAYDLYTIGETIPAGKQVGDRKGTSTPIETVTFNAAGTEAYSDRIGAGVNILGEDGIIRAQTFWYNTNNVPVEIEGVDIPTHINSNDTTSGSTNLLPAETFYWKMGTINTTELALRYYVYLEDSLEGSLPAGSYSTNEYATLYYDNYLDAPCYKDTVSPVMPWKDANVSYAFYLVNRDGEIIVNQTTGQTGTFANKVAVTNPVVYKSVNLNSLGDVNALEVKSLDVLPEGYTLYDNTAAYTVRVNSNGTGSWEIKQDAAKVDSTYVTEFNGEAYSNQENVNGSYDYTHTVVWFAVLWEIQALPDTVVIDYGLPVDISVLSNDMFGENGALAGVGAYNDDLNLKGHDNTMAQGFANEYKGEYGSASINKESGKVRYQVANMQMNGYEKFAYAVNYTGTANPGYYYDTVTVIPATTIYYEDEFVKLTTYNENGTDENGNKLYNSVAGWTVNSEHAAGVQAEDRPGEYALTDANNIYGFDNAYQAMSEYSMGHSAMVHVQTGTYATAEFDFYGTGFDVISMTSNTTGTLTVKVVAAENIAGTTIKAGDSVKNMVVDTYYGYTRDEEGKWVAAPDADNSIYQVPVIKAEGLNYGKYHVVITASYVPLFDHNSTAEGYDLYLDAIRIYDPANDGAADGTEDETIEDAYAADGEGWPSYFELRNNLIEAGKLSIEIGDTEIEGQVFIDGVSAVDDAQIKDYENFGPNNEVYLAKDQSIAFLLKLPENIDNVHIGVKSADGKACNYTIKNVAKAQIGDQVDPGDIYNEKTYTVSTATDMYYDLGSWKNDIIVITNNSDSILSLTNIKFTYESAPAQTVNTLSLDNELEAPITTGYAYMTPAAAVLTLRALNAPVVEEPDVSEPTEPEATLPQNGKAALEEAVAKASALNSKDYTKDSYKVLKDALKAAEKVLKDKKATQDEINAAAEALNQAINALVPVEGKDPSAFVPGKLMVDLNKSSAKVGTDVVVTITTDKTVKTLMINGQKLTKFTRNWKGDLIWVTTVEAAQVGIMEISVTAINSKGNASEPVVKTVEVTSRYNSVGEWIGDLIGSWLDIWF